MKQRTKRLLSWALSLAMVIGLMSGMSLTALAGDGNPYADLVPTGSEETGALTAKQVTFNGKQWYIIKDESTAENAGTLTLLYAGSLGSVAFDTGGSNNYANSSIKTALGNLTAENGYYYPVAEAIKDTGNGELYLLSEDEANAVPQNVRKDFNSDAWWLRTARENSKVAYVFVTATDTPGRIPTGGLDPTTSIGIRPALQLDLSKVVFDSETKTFAIPATAPTISSVTGATLMAGYGAGSVKVAATAADGHTLSYQWYQSTTSSKEGGTLIENATSATYDIPTGKEAGTYYYYCVVTATRTDNSQTASATSDVAVVTVAADTDELVAKLAEEKSIDLSHYYLIPAEDMYFTANEYWNQNSSWEKLPDEAGEKHVATKQFTIQGLPKESLIFCKAYYAFGAVAWGSDTGKIETIGKRYSLLTTISDQFDWWDTYSLFGFNLTKYVEGDFNTKVEAELSTISDAFRIYVPKGEAVAKIGDDSYYTLADAVRAAGSGGTIKLLCDATDNLVLTSGQNITLDLNGYTLTNDGRHCTIVAQNGSTLVVTDSSEGKTGKVDNTTHGCAPLYNNGGTVTLNGGNFIRSKEAGIDGGNTYYTVVNRGTMTINEGVTVNNDAFHYSSLIANGYNELTKTGYREIDPKVSNGYVEGESAANPTLTINGGTFKGGNQALKNDVNGIATIKGGSFSSTAGNAIKNLSELTISGGMFTAEAEDKFALHSAAESGKTYGPESANGTATVTGGTFIGKLQKDEGATLTVSGGEFSEIVPEDCCAEGYQPATTKNSNGMYFVILPVYSGGGSGAATYAPAVSETENGTATVSPTSPKAGDKVTVTPKPDEGYEVDIVTVTDESGKAVEVTKNADGTYSFTQPAGKVTISATFKKIADPDANCPMKAFTDLDPNAWYHDGVHWALENGVMNGVGGDKFDPDGTTTRAMIVTILYRLEGKPDVSGKANPFEDVADGQWYTDAVIWAAENKIVSGYGDGKFGPDDPITREQLAAILYRYAQTKGEGFQGLWSFKLDFPDAGDVSDWATEAMSWMVMNGIINGKDGKLVPGGNATRAEAATMLMRYLSA